jgi:alkanesulfonate monooxygenase SsuD/methylene tetrahydromethanopterin reductase-like flavin-dependent oxidoreductase (luciferase family)
MARKGPVTYEGKQYTLPYQGDDATGLGKPLKSIMDATSIPIYTASITNKGVETSAELADGVFPVWMNPDRYDIFAPNIEKGFAKAGGGKSLADFAIAPFVTAVMGDDVERCRMPVKGMMALYIGGMGARGKNFYNDYCKALGFEDAAVKIQDLYLAGKKDEAMAAVPNELVDGAALVGPKERIVERLQAWKAAGKLRHVDSMLIGSGDAATLKVIAEEML